MQLLRAGHLYMCIEHNCFAGYTEDVLGYIRESVAKTMLADLKDSVRNDRDLNIQDKYGASAVS